MQMEALYILMLAPFSVLETTSLICLRGADSSSLLGGSKGAHAVRAAAIQ